jgi:FkbM family methyltransferase
MNRELAVSADQGYAASRTLRARLRPLARALLTRGLQGFCGEAIERVLVALGHQWPHRLPGRGLIVESLRQRHAGTEVIARIAAGGRLSVPATREALSFYLHGHAYMEDHSLTRFLGRTLHAGDTFIDVGASLGYYTILAARAGVSVHAFEPQPLLAEHLRRSVRLNTLESCVHVTQAAVSDQHGGVADLFLAHDDETLIGVPSLLRHEWLSDRDPIRVPVVSLDEYSRERGLTRIHLLKIDVEGAELLVLHGMRSLLEQRLIDVIVAEVWPETLTFDSIHRGEALRPSEKTTRASDLRDFLTRFGFRPRRITTQGTLGDDLAPAELERVSSLMNIAFVR